MKQQGINVGLREQSEKFAPVGAQGRHQEQMPLRGVALQRDRALLEPDIAHRNVFPSRGPDQRVVRPPQVRHLDAALKRDDRAQLELFERMLLGYLRKMGGTVDYA